MIYIDWLKSLGHFVGTVFPRYQHYSTLSEDQHLDLGSGGESIKLCPAVAKIVLEYFLVSGLVPMALADRRAMVMVPPLSQVTHTLI